uniref:NADH-ubiquinone oxidoreductase chain 4 n=1 Tax=Eulimnogammarus vittatus TaxID=58370 RepID=A0A0U1XH75_EULVI|nr:NADH dehydrogenase subunit 4 [Eulimnogammarus vittatus]AIT99451.1 NADH dehydrogenase subunit 4 [Eulimnogammarus vittatus]
MLSIFVMVFSTVLVAGFWGESLVLMVFMSGLVSMSSSDNLVWKVGLSGELDYVGWALSLLSFWVVFLAVLGSQAIKKSSSLSYIFVKLMLALLGLFLISFYVSDFLFFYLGFESCLIPIFFMILGWGYQPERAQAGIYMLFYTLLGSLPLFFLIMDMYSKSSGYMYMVSEINEVFLFVFLVGAFLVKFPMYSTHLWLLKAHVEAPVAGSMILAGVMLKLGGYGLIRFLPVCQITPLLLVEVLVCVSLWGGLVLSLSCLRQMDMKLLIASSSVVHMSLCIVGLLTQTDWGFKGAMVVMIGHGVCSSGLFYLANVMYERSHSRSLAVSKGFLALMPSMCLWWFILLGVNMAAPPSLNLLGEIMLINTVISWSNYMMVVVMVMSFFSAGYSLYLFSLSQHGVYLNMKSGFHSGVVLEYLVCAAHWIPLNIVILSMAWLI